MIGIVCKSNNNQSNLAKKEIKKYCYELYGELVEEKNFMEDDSSFILSFGNDEFEKKYQLSKIKLQEGGYVIRKVEENNKKIIIFYGRQPIAVLYAVYRFFEFKGVKYYLHGDVLPADKTELFSDIYVVENPLFAIRGMLPYHDFAEGPDIWNKEDYESFVRQLVKMRCNLLEIHNYFGEPGVWVGFKEDITEEGNVLTSFPVHHFKTNGNAWGFQNFRTTDYYFDAGKMFSKAVCCGPYMDEYREDNFHAQMGDENTSVYRYNKMFDEFGDILKHTFEYAKSLGMKIAIGHHIPLNVPACSKKHYNISPEITNEERIRLYEGLFERIKRKYPIDYYFFWTTEAYGWNLNPKKDYEGVFKDIECAKIAWGKVGKPFKLGSAGWTLGPGDEPLAFDKILPEGAPMSALNRSVGNQPVDMEFANLKNRPGWSIPWAEDDPAMTIPQLWVGRMRKDSYDSLKYGCEGLIGIHWRTKNITHNLNALAESAWSQEGWKEKINPNVYGEGFINADSSIVEFKNEEDIYKFGRRNSSGYNLDVGVGTYNVTLYFNNTEECMVDIGLNATFTNNFIKKQESLLVGKSEVKFCDIKAEAPQIKISINNIKGNNILCAIVIEGNATANQLESRYYKRTVNCGSSSDYKLYDEKFRMAESEDFYVDWAENEFGKDVAKQVAEIFAEQDGKLPRPVEWRGQEGPGLIIKNEKHYEIVSQSYNFVDKFSALKNKIKLPEQLERFEYWENTFILLRQLAYTGCLWGAFNKAYSENRNEELLPTFEKILVAMKKDFDKAMECVFTKGDLGTMINLIQSSYGRMMTECREKAKERGIDLPEVKYSPYQGKKRLVVLTQQTGMLKGSKFNLEFITLGGTNKMPKFKYRYLGEKDFKELPVRRIAEWVYETESFVPEETFEYYIESEVNFPVGKQKFAVIVE